MIEKHYSLEEISTITGIKIPTLRAWVARRLFPIVRLGRRVKVRESDLRQFIEERVVPARPKRER